MEMAAEAQIDWRVVAIQEWAEKYSLKSLVEQHSIEDLTRYVFGVRSGEGAIKKFCAAAGIDNPAYARQVTPAGDRPVTRKPIRDIQDGEELAVVLEERGIKMAACPTCFITYSVTGKCECSQATPGLQKKLGYLEPKAKRQR